MQAFQPVCVQLIAGWVESGNHINAQGWIATNPRDMGRDGLDVFYFDDAEFYRVLTFMITETVAQSGDTTGHVEFITSKRNLIYKYRPSERLPHVFSLGIEGMILDDENRVVTLFPLMWYQSENTCGMWDRKVIGGETQLIYCPIETKSVGWHTEEDSERQAATLLRRFAGDIFLEAFLEMAYYNPNTGETRVELVASDLIVPQSHELVDTIPPEMLLIEINGEIGDIQGLKKPDIMAEIEAAARRAAQRHADDDEDDLE